MLHLPANVVSKSARGELAESDTLFSFGTDFTWTVKASHHRSAVILYIALPETKDNIDPG
jgi:hypothetical protein